MVKSKLTVRLADLLVLLLNFSMLISVNVLLLTSVQIRLQTLLIKFAPQIVDLVIPYKMLMVLNLASSLLPVLKSLLQMVDLVLMLVKPMK